jgi:tetratricopeptide (TPR) repeat protein
MTYRTYATLCFLARTLSAQHFVPTYPVSVELQLPPEQSNAPLRGELTGTVAASPPVQAWMYNGRIDFTGVPAGSYQLRIVNSQGAVLKTLFLQSGAESSRVLVDLTSPSRLPSSGSSISVHALLHKPPARAVQLLVHARREDGEQAVALLREALAEDPDYFEAHVSLGIKLLQLKQFSQAELEFKKAAAERPDSAIAAADLAAAEIPLHRLVDAELAARRAVSIDSTLPQAHFLLAEALISQVLVSPDEMKRQEAATHLQLVLDKIPQAKALLDWTAQPH